MGTNSLIGRFFYSLSECAENYSSGDRLVKKKKTFIIRPRALKFGTQ